MVEGNVVGNIEEKEFAEGQRGRWEIGGRDKMKGGEIFRR